MFFFPLLIDPSVDMLRAGLLPILAIAFAVMVLMGKPFQILLGFVLLLMFLDKALTAWAETRAPKPRP